jgi:hypothetical protein
MTASRQTLAELAMTICAAAKPDDPVQFVQMMTQLIRVAEDGALEDAGPLPHVQVDAGARIPPGIVDALRGACPYCHVVLEPSVAHTCQRMAELGFADKSMATVTPVAASSMGAAEAERNADIHTGVNQPAASVTPPAAPAKLRTRLSADDRARMKAEYDAAKGSGGRGPNGILDRLARDYRCSISTVKAVVHTHYAPSDAPVREHGHSHACWCRKSANTAANRWCSNKPAVGIVPSLAGLNDPRRRGERYRRLNDYEND